MHDLPLLTTIAAGFGAAWLFGLLARAVKLSPIVGYMVGGMVIGPFTPGYVGDVHAAAQLAEIGVILLMFGVGLHFHLEDLLRVRGIAVPGAVVQSAAATLISMGVFAAFGWPLTQGLVLGMALSVASTVVLLRVLLDKGILNTPQGHAAVGWLIVEDIFTVLALVVVPIIGTMTGEAAGAASAAQAQSTPVWWTILSAFLKLGVVVAMAVLGGKYIVPWLLSQVAKLRSRELFTLTVLVLSISFAVGASAFFGVSVALGAFLAGMVVAQTPASHQAASDALPMRDAFAVLFFVSVGMMFDPSFIINEPLMTLCGLGIVLVVKPLSAWAVVWALGYPVKTVLTVAVGLAQIGEFSFILAQTATQHRILPESATQLLVVTAILSIALNPLLFSRTAAMETWLKKRPKLWKFLNARADGRATAMNATLKPVEGSAEKPLAIVVGHGPPGRLVNALLRDAGMQTMVIEMNLDTVERIRSAGGQALYGDASSQEILDQAGVQRAVHLVVTTPDPSACIAIVSAARELNPKIEITARARYLNQQPSLKAAGANTVVVEEGEAGLTLARHVLTCRKVDPAIVSRLLTSLRKVWGIEVGGA
jgi:CPA2 family monovalent cation:H+ antiporter-2